MQYAMLTVAAVLLAAEFSINRVYQRRAGVSPEAGFGFNSMFGLFWAVIFFVLNGFKVSFSPYSFAMAAAMSMLVMVYNIIGFRFLKRGAMALYTLFLMSGGMLVPYIWGILFLGEPCTVLRTAAVLIILVGVVLANVSREKADFRLILMCAAVFLLNGFCSVVSKLHQIEADFVTVGTADFVILNGSFKFFFAGILWFFARRQREEGEPSPLCGRVLPIIAASAAVGGISYVLQLIGAKTLPATVLYPFITGGSIVFSTLAGWLIFKDKLSKQLVLGIILCVIGTVMFL